MIFFSQRKIPLPRTILALSVGELAGGKKMKHWGFPKVWKWGYYLKNRDKHHNASQEKFSTGGGGFGHENM